MSTNTLESRLVAAQTNLLELRAAHGDASLALAQGHGTDAEVDSLEDEIKAVEKAVQRLEAAMAAQAQAQTEEAREVRDQARMQARQRVDQLGRKMEALALQMVQQVEGLGPLLAEFEVLSTARSSAASETISFPVLSTAKAEHEWATVAQRAALRQGAVPSAILAALWRTGITKVLSVEYAGATLPPPDYSGPFGQGDLGIALKETFARTQAALDAQIGQIQKRHQR